MRSASPLSCFSRDFESRAPEADSDGISVRGAGMNFRGRRPHRRVRETAQSWQESEATWRSPTERGRIVETLPRRPRLRALAGKSPSTRSGSSYSSANPTLAYSPSPLPSSSASISAPSSSSSSSLMPSASRSSSGPVEEFAQARQSPQDQEGRCRHIGVGCARLRAARPGCDQSGASQCGDHVAADISA
jgi:hypothetical protein